MTPILHHYLTEYEKLTQSTSAPFNHTRQTALDSFLKTGFPTVKDEAWRYMARATLLQQPFKIAAPVEKPTTTLLPNATDEAKLRIVFVDGYFAPQLSSAPQAYPLGVSIKSVAAQLTHLSDTDSFQEEKQPTLANSFTALNTAFFQDGAIITIDDNCMLTQPIEVWFIQKTTTESRFIPMRNLFKVGENSQVHFIERFVTENEKAKDTAGASHFTNVVATLDIAPHARVTWSQVITTEEQDCHVGQLEVTQHPHSQFQAESVVLGGGLVRHTFPTYLTGEGATCTLNGLSIAKNRHHIDHALAIYHQASHTQSEVHYRAIADDRSRIAFSGGVYVVKGISKIQANQHNHNLLLSAQAEIDTQPKLELFADDIMCTHGATVGEIDETALFYLQARGITASEARFILMNAFGQAIFQKMTISSDPQLQSQLIDFTKQSEQP